jgi:hypothetical protein
MMWRNRLDFCRYPRNKVLGRPIGPYLVLGLFSEFSQSSCDSTFCTSVSTVRLPSTLRAIDVEIAEFSQLAFERRPIIKLERSY